MNNYRKYYENCKFQYYRKNKGVTLKEYRVALKYFCVNKEVHVY